MQHNKGVLNNGQQISHPAIRGFKGVQLIDLLKF